MTYAPDSKPVGVRDIRADLLAEQDELAGIVAAIDGSMWSTPTASPGWTIADQIGHLAYFDQTAAWAIADEAAWRAARDALGLAAKDGTVDGLTLGTYREMHPAALLQSWHEHRHALAEAAMTLADDDRVEWYGPSMGAKSFLTARLMETWAHGQHIADALGVTREPTDRIRHIVRLGVLTRGWAFVNRGLDAPTSDIRVELRAPSGELWVFGGESADQSVVGNAVDFCQVVTQCCHVSDTGLVVSGEDAQRWMEIAQAFAGPPTDGPRPRSQTA